MKSVKSLTLILLFSMPVMANAQIDTSRSNAPEIIHKVDTLNAETVEKMQETLWYEHKSTPWLVSIFIAVLSVVVNLIISYFTRKTSIRTVQDQIQSSVKIASHQFHATLNSKNRQEWINDVRNCISEFVTQCRLLNMQFQEPVHTKEKRYILHEKVSLYRNKILLLLSPQIPQHANFLGKMNELLDALEIHLLNSRANILDYNNQEFLVKSNEVLESGRTLLYFEWQKIQNVKFD